MKNLESIKDNLPKNIVLQAENKLDKKFKELEDIALHNQEKILNAFLKNKISYRHFSGTTGYGYDDIGRDALSVVFSDAFGSEKAIVSPFITCGSHAITIALFGILRPGDVLLSITGKPYDTLDETIWGREGEDIGSLKDYGVKYEQIELSNNSIDIEQVRDKIKILKPKMIYLQRSRGYAWRPALSIKEMQEIFNCIKQISPQSVIFVDNCYGEFVEKLEPTDVGADICAGSLIKNPGGGLAPSGGYIVGKAKYINQIASRFQSPSLGLEVASYEAGYRLFYQGLFMAPHTVLQAQKGAFLIGEVLKQFGFEVLPDINENAYDIIKSIKFETAEQLISFVQTIQTISPIDGFVTPEPWDMPGYTSPVIMAAGTFVGGASIELSCDSPIRAPYVGYLQGSLTYEHAKIAALRLAEKFGA